MDDKTTPETAQEKPEAGAAQPDQAQAAAGASPEEMEAKLQEALASWPRNADGALLDREKATQVSEGVWEGPLLPDGIHPVTAADGTVMEFEVKNETQPQAEAGAEQAQAGQAEAGAEQPGLADLPAADLPAADLPAPDAAVDGDLLEPIDKLQTEAVKALHERMGIEGNPPQAVSEAVFKAVSIRFAAANEMVNPRRIVEADAMLRGTMDGVMEAAGSSAEKVSTQEIGKLLNDMVGRAMSEAITKNFSTVTPEDITSGATAPHEPSHLQRQAGEVVGDHTNKLAQTAPASAMVGQGR